MRRIIISSIILIVVLSMGFIGGYSNSFSKNERTTYSGLSGIAFKVNLSTMAFKHGDIIGKISECRSIELPKCLKFDETVIAIPTNQFLSEVSDLTKELNDEINGLTIEVSKREYKILDEVLVGYLIYLKKNSFTEYSGSVRPQAYFYTKKYGVLFLEHHYKVGSSPGTIFEEFEFYWADEKCGLFANKCK